MELIVVKTSQMRLNSGLQLSVRLRSGRPDSKCFHAVDLGSWKVFLSPSLSLRDDYRPVATPKSKTAHLFPRRFSVIPLPPANINGEPVSCLNLAGADVIVTPEPFSAFEESFARLQAAADPALRRVSQNEFTAVSLATARKLLQGNGEPDGAFWSPKLDRNPGQLYMVPRFPSSSTIISGVPQTHSSCRFFCLLLVMRLPS